ncbi:hypothetical protein [Metapseudomonas otitidis]|uniref:hypothetical protein n=1 Tax=Metapseudomonas otitidis TaxID=319939 RepID=UPI0037426CA2
MDARRQVLEGGETVDSPERKTIVFRQEQENTPWLACHERLSAMPDHLPPT